MSNKVKTSLIITVYNEEKTILPLLVSIKKQTQIPEEIIIIDAESEDRTTPLIKKFITENQKLNIKLIIKRSNRSVGRNEAIRQACNKIILATDAGSILNEEWVEYMTQPFIQNPHLDVVAGWYQPITKNPWQKSLAKVLNFNAKNINPEKFLPSSRSMAFKKSVWERVGGYPENIKTTSEDTIFDLKLKKAGAEFAFQPKAVVYWEINNNYFELYKRIKQYAYTDGLNKLWLSQYKILFIFLLIILLLLGLGLWSLAFLFILAYLYLPFWQAKKIDSIKELYRIPLIKGTIIMANIIGYSKGLLKL